MTSMIGDKLAIRPDRVALLQEKPLSTAEISEALGLNPSEVAKHMNSSSQARAGQVRRGQQLLRPRHGRGVGEHEKEQTMDTATIDRIIDKHHGEASALIQVLLEIQSETTGSPRRSSTRSARSCRCR